MASSTKIEQEVARIDEKLKVQHQRGAAHDYMLKYASAALSST